MKQIFFDESGDTGFHFDKGSSRFLVACLVVFPSAEDYALAQTAMKGAREGLRKHPNHEFKSSKLTNRTKEQILRASLASSWYTYAFVLNKDGLAIQNALTKKHSMYKKVVSMLFSNAVHELENSHLMMDRCGNRFFYESIRENLNATCQLKNRQPPADFRPADSASSDGLQLADQVAGAINRYYCKKPQSSELYQVFSGRCRQVRYWPRDG